MARLIFRGIDNMHPDPNKDLSGSHKKGDCVEILETGENIGDASLYTRFACIDVAEVTVEAAEAYKDEWQQIIDYEIVQTNSNLDAARIRLFATLPGSAGEYGLTRAKAENYFDKWNGAFHSAAANSIIFNITVEGIYTSQKFWDTASPPADYGVVITETDYNKTTGIHTATIISTGSVPIQSVEIRAIEGGATVLNNTGDVITAEFPSLVIRQFFLSTMLEDMRETNKRHRFAISAADVDLILAAGGVITATAAQLNSKLIDKTA